MSLSDYSVGQPCLIVLGGLGAARDAVVTRVTKARLTVEYKGANGDPLTMQFYEKWGGLRMWGETAYCRHPNKIYFGAAADAARRLADWNSKWREAREKFRDAQGVVNVFPQRGTLPLLRERIDALNSALAEMESLERIYKSEGLGTYAE